MWGQWIGRISGTNEGHIRLNIDRDQPYSGVIAISEDSLERVSAHSNIALIVNGTSVTGVLSQFVPSVYGVSPEIYAAAQNALPKGGTLRGKIDGNKIEGTWETDLGTKGDFKLQKHEGDFFVDPNKVLSWHDYHIWVLEQKRNRPGLIFRGHDSNQFNLRTSFHKTGRRDLVRYAGIDIAGFARYVSPLTRRV